MSRVDRAASRATIPRMSPSEPAAFVSVDVEPGPASEDGVSLRFKRVAGAAPRSLDAIPYESEAGLDGRWRIVGASDAEASATTPARAFLVEDSSDGTAWLIVGGAHGLLLAHEETGLQVREPYLVLSRRLL
jgi:hypothetical protein